ncbi:hypothetical protein B9479_006101 [Cryptococcus floricola]|uniref:Uncharacterized protein n=1 Tax=Cryptococcus floricola TaxID=2591691 RepID=A0A5D3AP27_9TREE|nr:hypothetical protein B9479_006101 [Cryptococcus floricola]
MSQPDSQEEANYVYPDPSKLDEGNPLGRHPYYRTVDEEVDEEASEVEYRFDELEEYQYGDEYDQFQEHTDIQDSEGYSTSQQEQLTATTSGPTRRRRAGTDCPCPVKHTYVLSRAGSGRETRKVFIEGPTCPSTSNEGNIHTLCYPCN